jgi:putative membrane protein
MGIRIYIGLALLLLVVVFIVQNATAVDIQFLFWKLSMSRSLMIFFVLAIGIVIGWITAGHFHRKYDKSGEKRVT